MVTKLATTESDGTMSAETAQSRDTVRFVLNGASRVANAPDPNATLRSTIYGTTRVSPARRRAAWKVTADVRWRPINACIHFLGMVNGREVVTIEGLRAPDGALHPVQKCFVDRHAAQCGFCSPGFLMSQNRLNSRHEVEDAVAGNLCRCTGYGPIIAAALDAGRLEEPAHIADCDAARTSRRHRYRRSAHHPDA